MKTSSLQHAVSYLERRLQQHGFTHLGVRSQGTNLVIYSLEQGEPAQRAIMCLFGDTYVLGIAGPRGDWQPTPFVGTPAELFVVLTRKLVFPLARWPESRFRKNG